MPSGEADRGDRTARRWLTAATIVAIVATSGSLWFSLGLGLVPCELCWYQRILMYPLVIVLGVAALESRPNVVRTVVPLSTLGLCIAAYQSYLQLFQSSCSFAGECAVVQWRLPVLGLSIPNLSFVAFVLVTLAVLAGNRWAFGSLST